MIVCCFSLITTIIVGGDESHLLMRMGTSWNTVERKQGAIAPPTYQDSMAAAAGTIARPDSDHSGKVDVAASNATAAPSEGSYDDPIII